jgi:hypothetical protein
LETPEGCFYEILLNNRELFAFDCGFAMPELCNEESYIKEGPNLILLYNPALGPLYSIIAQKIRSGRLAEGSEMQLEIAEVDFQNIELAGSLIVEAESLLGHATQSGKKRYSELTGKCEMKNIVVQNKGIKRRGANVYWKNILEREEKLHIILKGNAEFAAENLTFEGNHTIEVPDGYRWTAFLSGGKIEFKKEQIAAPTWFWKYSFTEDHSVRLTKQHV